MTKLALPLMALLIGACATSPAHEGNTDPWIAEWEKKREEVERNVVVQVRNNGWQDVTVYFLTPAPLRVGYVSALSDGSFTVKRAWINGRRIVVELDPLGGNPVRLYMDFSVPESTRAIEVLVENRLENSSISARF